MAKLTGKVALITGAAVGLGEGIATAYAKYGAKLCMVDLSPEVEKTAEKLRKEYNAEIVTCVANVADPEQMKAAAAKAAEAFGEVNIACCNAGVCRLAPFEEMTDAVRDFHIDVNIKGVWNTCKAVIPYMLKQGGGSIVIASSVTGDIVADAGEAAYAMTKAALVGLTKCLAVEYANRNIRVNCSQLGYARTPMVEKMAKEEDGREKLERITRYTGIGLALVQSIGIVSGLQNQAQIVTNPGFLSYATIGIVCTAGTAFLVWLGERITEKGIGNGISIILFVSIVARFPNSIIRQINNVANGDLAWWVLVLMYLGALLLIVLIVLVNDAERRLPVQYSKRVVGRKMYGGQSTHLPMKVNMSGVLPIIFAQSIAALPATICAFVPKWQNSWIMTHVFDTTTWPYIVIYFLLIIFFSYFYSTIQFNPIEVANNLKKNGGFIPGFRAGKPTSEFIQKVLNKITLFGAIYLSVIAITPLIISACSQAEQLTGISLGGTSIIIVVGVALETVRALEAQMLMRNYKGFLN